MTLPLLLYLRPFTSDGKVMVENPERWALSRNLIPTSSTGTELKVTLEELLLQSLSDLCSLIAIGRTVEVIGAGKVLASEENWRTYFRALSRKSRCIVAVPSNHESTAWELDWIAQERLFDRVVMIITEMHFSGVDVNFDLRTISRRLAASGWQLPTDLAAGALVSFDRAGQHSSHIPRSTYKKHVVRSFIERVITRVSPGLGAA